MRFVVPALCIVAFTVYGVGTLSASVPRWIALYAILIVGLGCASTHILRGRRVKVDSLDLLACLFLLYCAESLLWSGDWRVGVYGLANMTALVGLFMIVRRSSPEGFRLAVWTSVWIAAFDL